MFEKLQELKTRLDQKLAEGESRDEAVSARARLDAQTIVAKAKAVLDQDRQQTILNRSRSAKTTVRDLYSLDQLLKKPGEGEKTSSDLLITARSGDMGGDFSVMENVIHPWQLLPPHTHLWADQMVYVITGELVFGLGGEDGLEVRAPAGSYVQKPRGIVHTFWNDTDEPSRYIELSGGSSFEGLVDSFEIAGPAAAVENWAEHFGVIPDLDEAVRLIKEKGLKGLAVAETPGVSNLEGIPAPVLEALGRQCTI